MNYVSVVNNDDLKAQLYIKSVQNRHRTYRVNNMANLAQAPVSAVLKTPTALAPASVPIT
jgi:hypothetical protein